MSVDQVINVLVTITLIQLMVTIGLGVTFVELARVARNWGLVAQAALANYVLVPATTVGVLLLFFLVRFFQWMPPLEFTPLLDDPGANLKQLIWPALAEAYYISAPITRLTRSLMLEVIREDFVRTARAKGLPERLVVYHHALRNMLIPLVTFVGWS